MAATNTPAARLLAALAATAGPLTQAELALAAGCARSTASVALGKLAEEGAVVRDDSGKTATYALPASPEAELAAPITVRLVSTDPTAEHAHTASRSWEITAATTAEALDHLRGYEHGAAAITATATAANGTWLGGGSTGAGEPTRSDWDVAEGAAAALVAAVREHGLAATWSDAAITEVLVNAGVRTAGRAVELLGNVAGALAATESAAYAAEDAEVMAAEAAHAVEGDAPEAEVLGVPVAVLPHGGAAIPTAQDMRAGLTRGTWKQLGAALGDTVEVITANAERLTGELATSGGVCFLVVADGRQVTLGGWAAKQWGRLVSKRQAPAAPAAPAPAEAAEAPAVKVDRRKGPRDHYVPRGGLKAMVWAWYAANPGHAMTPHHMAKAIGAKAPGAVLDQQRNAVKAGYAVQHDAPLRFEWLAGVECPAEQAAMAEAIGFVPEPYAAPTAPGQAGPRYATA